MTEPESDFHLRDLAQRLGVAAHRRVGQEYLAPRRLTQELDLIDRVAG